MTISVLYQRSGISKEVLCWDMTYHIVITTYNDILIIPGFLFQHLTLGYLQAMHDFFYHLVMFNA